MEDGEEVMEDKVEVVDGEEMVKSWKEKENLKDGKEVDGIWK